MNIERLIYEVFDELNLAQILKISVFDIVYFAYI